MTSSSCGTSRDVEGRRILADATAGEQLVVRIAPTANTLARASSSF
jgi:hypothetical protein